MAKAKQAQEGKWMPKEPTDEMLAASDRQCHAGKLYPQDGEHGPRAMRRTEYAAMYASAPTVEAETRPTPPGLVEWLAGGRRGVSSNTIVQHLTGWPALRDWCSDVPHDPSDLDRCLQLLAQVPALRAWLPRMATCSREWAAMMERWAEIEASHLSEVGLGWTKGNSAPHTYKLMREVIDAARSMSGNSYGGTNA